METKTAAQWVSGFPMVEVHDDAGSLPELDKDAKITQVSLVVHQHGFATLYLEIERTYGLPLIRLQLGGKPQVELSSKPMPGG